MEHTFHINDSPPKAKAFLEFIKTLDFVRVGNGEVKFPSKTNEEIIQQAIQAEKEIAEGKTISQSDLVRESKNW